MVPAFVEATRKTVGTLSVCPYTLTIGAGSRPDY